MKKLKTVDVKGKPYVEVKERVLALAQERDDNDIPYSIETDYVYYPERKMWVVKAKLTWNGNVYTGLAQEIESDNYKEVNFAAALENAETSAVGRACGMAGIGVLEGIASADEVKKAVQRGSNLSNTKEGGEHTCKKCGAINENAEIREGQWGPFFKCGSCNEFSKPNPTNSKGAQLDINPPF